MFTAEIDAEKIVVMIWFCCSVCAIRRSLVCCCIRRKKGRDGGKRAAWAYLKLICPQGQINPSKISRRRLGLLSGAALHTIVGIMQTSEDVKAVEHELAFNLLTAFKKVSFSRQGGQVFRFCVGTRRLSDRTIRLQRWKLHLAHQQVHSFLFCVVKIAFMFKY